MEQQPALVALELQDPERFGHDVAAIWAVGDAVLPVRSTQPQHEIDRVIEACRPSFLQRGQQRVPLEGGVTVAPDTAVVLTTSGTTGTPKAVELSHRALAAAAGACHERLGATGEDRWLCCVPLDHVAGFSILVRSALLGQKPRFAEPSDVAGLASADATLVSLVPTQLRRALDAGIDLSRYRSVLVGGDATPPTLLQRAREAGINVVRTYGSTETGGGVVYDGLALKGVRVRLSDRGHIEIASPTLMTRYRLSPGLTQERMRDGWFDTGDTGVLNNGVLGVLGRSDGVVISGGEKVAPIEVERLLIEHPGVAEAVVLGVDDEHWGQRVIAVVVPAPGETPSPTDLRAFLDERVARYKLPKEIFVAEAIPREDSGRTDLPALRRLFGH
jgi:o-succinylbenzoate---CoA ligase